MKEIVLSWPPRELHPNARVHFHEKARRAKIYREAAYWLTEKAGADPGDNVTICLDFHPPDNRRRDLDGMLSAIKSGLDGIADALGVNDHNFALRLHRCEPIKGGRVVVTLEAA